jgi:hypothetical protein
MAPAVVLSLRSGKILEVFGVAALRRETERRDKPFAIELFVR